MIEWPCAYSMYAALEMSLHQHYHHHLKIDPPFQSSTPAHFSLIVVYPHTTHTHHTTGQSAPRQPGGGEGGKGEGASRPTMPAP